MKNTDMFNIHKKSCPVPWIRLGPLGQRVLSDLAAKMLSYLKNEKVLLVLIDYPFLIRLRRRFELKSLWIGQSISITFDFFEVDVMQISSSLSSNVIGSLIGLVFFLIPFSVPLFLTALFFSFCPELNSAVISSFSSWLI